MTAGRRVHERYERRLKAVIHHEGGKLECISQNISLGGMQLASTTPLPYGSNVELQFFLPALKEHVKIGAIVRWARDGALGLQFGSLRAREVWGLNQLFKEGD